MSTSWTLSDIAALEAAIGKGQKRVTYSDYSVEHYDSIEEMLTLLEYMKRAVSPPTGGGTVYAGRLT